MLDNRLQQPAARLYSLWIAGILLPVAVLGAPVQVSASDYCAYVSTSPFTAIDTSTNTVAATAVTPGGRTVALLPDGTRAYVAEYEGLISVVDTASLTVVATIPAGGSLTGIATSPDGAEVYVANFLGQGVVKVISSATNAVTASINTGVSAALIAVSPDGGRAYVTSTGPMMPIIDLATNSLAGTIHVPDGETRGVAVSPDGSRIYVNQFGLNRVAIIDANSNAVIGTVPVGINPTDGIAVTPDGSRVYVGNYGSDNVSVISTASNSVIATIPVGSRPYDLAITPDGAFVYVVNNGSPDVSVIDTASETVIATIPLGDTGTAVAVGAGPSGCGAFPTSTATNTPIATSTATLTGTATSTPSVTATASATSTATATETTTPTPASTATSTESPTGTPTPTAGACLASPRLCREGGRSLLMVRHQLSATSDRLIWRWTRGPSTTQAEFGDPSNTTAYTLCIYAHPGASLIGQAAIPGSASRWAPLSDKGYRYSDADATADGIAKVVLKGSDANKSKALVKGRGVALPDLPLGSISGPVQVQLVNGDSGLCWSATYTGAQIVTNDGAQLKAKAP